jgi:hypothetical protein
MLRTVQLDPHYAEALMTVGLGYMQAPDESMQVDHYMMEQRLGDTHTHLNGAVVQMAVYHMEPEKVHILFLSSRQAVLVLPEVDYTGSAHFFAPFAERIHAGDCFHVLFSHGVHVLFLAVTHSLFLSPSLSVRLPPFLCLVLSASSLPVVIALALVLAPYQHIHMDCVFLQNLIDYKAVLAGELQPHGRLLPLFSRRRFRAGVAVSFQSDLDYIH